jgi:hypothetical protein
MFAPGWLKNNQSIIEILKSLPLIGIFFYLYNENLTNGKTLGT